MPAQRVTPAKITRPHPRRVHLRTRLFDLFNDAKDTPCIWICGPPGAGKTTLAASYCDQMEKTTLWYQVDEGDTDVASFFYYLNQAAKQVTRRRKNLPLFTVEFAGELTAFSRRYFEKLYSWLKPPFVLALDNYQLTGPDALIHEVIVSALESLPVGGQIMVLSRQEPPAEFARSRANRDIRIIDWPALRLTQGELNEIVKLHKSGPLSSQELNDLETRSDGWIAGLVLMLQGEVQAMPHDRQPRESSPHVIFDYFAREIFRQQPEDVQKILMQAALLPKMNAQTASELTDNANAGQVLSDLYHRNYFTQRHGQSKASFQFHPLFRDFLQTQLRQSITMEQMQGLQNKAALILEASGQSATAIELFCTAGNYSDAIRLISDLAPDLLDQGRYKTVRNWIRRLPQATIETSPWLIYWLACCENFTDPPAALKNFDSAYRGFKAADDLSGTCLAWSGVVDSIFIQICDYSVLKDWIVIGEQLLRDNPVFPSLDIETRVVASMCCALTISQPDHPMVPELSERARKLLIAIPDSPHKLNITLMLFNDCIWRGRITDARSLLFDFALQEIDTDSGVAFRTFQYSMQVILEYMTGDLEGALQTTKAGLALCDVSGVTVFRLYLLVHGAWAALGCGNQSLAREFIESFAEQTPTGHGYATYFWTQAWLDWASGHPAEGLEKTKISLLTMEKIGHVFAVGMMQLYLSFLQLELGEFRKSRTNMDEAMKIAESGHSGWIKFNYFFIDALYQLKQDQKTAYFDALRQGFALGRELELYTALWWDPVRMSQHCATALEHNIEVNYVQEMIRKNKLVPDQSAAALNNWPWPIRIYVLGEFRLVIDGKVIGSGSKTQRKIIELLKALVVFGGREISASHLTDVLWPDSEGDDAVNALKTAVHRLRKLLGHPEAIVVSAGHLSLNFQCCWTDLDNFEQLIEEASSETGNITALGKAIDLYKAPLLNSEEDVSWQIAPSECLRSKFLTTVTIAGTHWESKQEWHKAIRLYERALEVDHLIEAFYLQLMHCHQSLGELAEAISTYKRCTRVLAADLGVEPSHELQTLGNSLMT